MTNHLSTPDVLHKLVHAMDRSADAILQKQFGISYKRAYFLLVLQNLGTATQHQLATALGYSDASVSTMLSELSKSGYVVTEPSPRHGRKKLVTLTDHGADVIAKGREVLDARFNAIMKDLGINTLDYHKQTERLYLAITTKVTEDTK